MILVVMQKIRCSVLPGYRPKYYIRCNCASTFHAHELSDLATHLAITLQAQQQYFAVHLILNTHKVPSVTGIHAAYRHSGTYDCGLR